MASKIVSGVFLGAYLFYSLGRFRVSRIGGMYMLKRIVLAVLLTIVRGNTIILSFCAIAELLFLFLRIHYEYLPFGPSC